MGEERMVSNDHDHEPWPEVSYGAMARAAAMVAGDPDWVNVTRWPRDSPPLIEEVRTRCTCGSTVPGMVEWMTSHAMYDHHEPTFERRMATDWQEFKP